MTPPFLLKNLSADQRLRVLALDYVTSSGLVVPEDWIGLSSRIERYLKEGEQPRNQTTIYHLPVKDHVE